MEGKDVALLGYGSMVQNCLRAHSLLSNFGVEVTVADARFCKPLDIKLIRHLCKNHSFLVTVEEGSIGGFASHVAQFLSLDGQLDAGIKVIVLFNDSCRSSLQSNISTSFCSGDRSLCPTTISSKHHQKSSLLLLA